MQSLKHSPFFDSTGLSDFFSLTSLAAVPKLKDLFFFKSRPYRHCLWGFRAVICFSQISIFEVGHCVVYWALTEVLDWGQAWFKNYKSNAHFLSISPGTDCDDLLWYLTDLCSFPLPFLENWVKSFPWDVHCTYIHCILPLGTPPQPVTFS